MSDNKPSNEYLIGCLQRQIESLESDVKELRLKGWLTSLNCLAMWGLFWLVVCSASDIDRKAKESVQAMIDKSIADHEAEKETK